MRIQASPAAHLCFQTAVRSSLTRASSAFLHSTLSLTKHHPKAFQFRRSRSTKMMPTFAVLAVALLLVAVQRVAAGDFDGWNVGRATHYDSIHSGSCMFGSLDANKGTGLDVAAISDKAPDYAGSCGRCYEVACRPGQFKDGYGSTLDRSSSCKSGSKVIVTITDTCPCWYPSNAYSNTRWCCGDMYHFDLSNQAFGKIANINDGVVGIYYRQVPCPGGWSHGKANRGGDKAWPNRGLKTSE